MHTVDRWSSCGVLGVICHLKKSRNVCNFICMNLSNLSRFWCEVFLKLLSQKKLVTIKWSGFSFCFYKWIMHFNASSQGANQLLTHMIKIQFLDINFQFWNIVDITALASKIGIVLEVESLESYIKLPTSHMIMFEVSNVTKLPWSILLPSLDLKDPIDATIMQCILYFGLSNQCRKCQRFGHFAKNCTCAPTRDGKGLDVNRQESWSEKVYDLTKSSNLQSNRTNGSIEQSIKRLYDQERILKHQAKCRCLF